MTAAQLYDELQAMFGIGDWSEASRLPWFRARMNEIGKLKRMLKSRRVTEDQVYLAAQYARAHDIAIVATWRLFELIPEARRWANTLAPANRLQAAIEETIAAGDTEWAMRLTNVHSSDKAAVASVLEEYESR